MSGPRFTAEQAVALGWTHEVAVELEAIERERAESAADVPTPAAPAPTGLRAALIRSGAYYHPTQAQRVELELAKLAQHAFFTRLRAKRAVEKAGRQ